jgi:tetratricopeptide (TPR) repeat protein
MTSKLSAMALLAGIGLALSLPPAPALAAGGGGGGVPSSGGGGDSSKRIAAGHYRAGLRARDAAWSHEKKAKQAADIEKAKRSYGRARRQFEKAIASQRKAIKAAPDMFQAHSSLGYALRRIGRYDEAIVSYDRALELEPSYGEAVEYRAEAYLQLGRLEDVQRAWGRLQNVPELAQQLMEAMERWVEKRRRAPGELDPARVEAFASWVSEQQPAARTAGAPTASARPGRW